jgi:GNAT superfamily N-acetyltransferase
MMRITELTDDHIDALAEVHTRGWQEGYRGQLPDELLDSLDPERRAEMWRRWLARDGDDLLVLLALDDEDRVIGFTATGPPRDDDVPDRCGELYAIYVEPDRWSGGIGSELMAAASDGLRDAGFEHAVLWVLESNERTRRFYAHHGWEPDGRAKVEAFGDVDLHELRYHRAL